MLQHSDRQVLAGQITSHIEPSQKEGGPIDAPDQGEVKCYPVRFIDEHRLRLTLSTAIYVLGPSLYLAALSNGQKYLKWSAHMSDLPLFSPHCFSNILYFPMLRSIRCMLAEMSKPESKLLEDNIRLY